MTAPRPPLRPVVPEQPRTTAQVAAVRMLGCMGLIFACCAVVLIIGVTVFLMKVMFG